MKENEEGQGARLGCAALISSVLGMYVGAAIAAQMAAARIARSGATDESGSMGF